MASEGRSSMPRPGGAPSEKEKLLSELHDSMSLKITDSADLVIELEEYGYSYTPEVYKVPEEIGELNKRAYSPSVVSIGPLHGGREHLQAMESQKLYYVTFLLYRLSLITSFAERVKEFEAAMLEMTPQCFAFYHQLSRSRIQKVKFAEMLLTDGCFILEHLLRNYYQKKKYEIIIHNSTDGKIIIQPDQLRDLIMDNRFMYVAVQCDLLQLENQIPFTVVQRLFTMTMERLPKEQRRPLSLTELVLSFFGGDDLTGHHLESICRPENRDIDHETRYHHILHLLHSCYMAPHHDHDHDGSTHASGDPEFNYSATQLDLAGVELLAGDKKDLFNVKFSATMVSTSTTTSSQRVSNFLFWWFWGKACFEIPPLRITYSTEPFLRNLVAFEQTSCVKLRHFTSHLFLLGKLMNTAEDVELLIKAGVIRNYLSSSEQVLHLFNNICKNVRVHEFYCVEPWKQASHYCERFWPRSVAKLKRNYFGNPWAVVSVFAATVLFVLTLLQTIYTMPGMQ